MADNDVRIIISAEDKTKKAIQSSTDGLKGLRGEVKGMIGDLKGIVTGFGVFTVASKVIGNLVKSVDDLARSGTVLSDAYLNQTQRSQEYSRSVATRELPLITSLKKAWNDLAVGTGEMTDEQVILVEAHQKGLITLSEYYDLVALGTIQTEQYKETIEELRPQVDAAHASLRDFAKEANNLKLEIQFQKSFDGLQDNLQAQYDRQAEIKKQLAELGVQEYVTPEQFSQLEDLRTTWNNAWFEYNNLQKAVDDGDLSPNKTQEANLRMEELEQTISNTANAAHDLGFTDIYSSEQQKQIDDLQQELQDSTGDVNDLAAAYSASTKEFLVNYLVQRATQLQGNEDTQDEGLALLGVASQLAEGWGLVGSEAITSMSDAETAIQTFLDSGQADALIDVFNEIDRAAQIHVRISMPGGNQGSGYGGGAGHEQGQGGVGGYASGGVLGSKGGIASVGEQGEEGAVWDQRTKQWVIIPHEQWMRMKAMGITAARGYKEGGGIGGGSGDTAGGRYYSIDDVLGNNPYYSPGRGPAYFSGTGSAAGGGSNRSFSSPSINLPGNMNGQGSGGLSSQSYATAAAQAAAQVAAAAAQSAAGGVAAATAKQSQESTQLAVATFSNQSAQASASLQASVEKQTAAILGLPNKQDLKAAVREAVNEVIR